MTDGLCYQGFEVVWNLILGYKGVENAGEVDADCCPVGGGDVHSILAVGGGRLRLDSRGPFERVERSSGGEKEECFLLFGAN